MKIPKSIRDLYDSQYDSNERLKELVDRRVMSLKHSSWHYESRIKSIESFALKIESGRTREVQNLEDFFACTIVVENQGKFDEAENMVKKHFHIKEIRPPDKRLSYIRPDSFPFNDIRIYVNWKDSSLSKPTGLDSITFEIQIKSFLQHAWTIATHDMVYKSEFKSWPKIRIASQIKAMLEHAETSIAEAEALSKNSDLDKTSAYIQDINETVELLKENWPPDRLPKDCVRVAETIRQLLFSINIDRKRLKHILFLENLDGRGSNLENLSPYGAILQSVMHHETAQVKRYLNSTDRRYKFILIVPAEVTVPSSLLTIDSERIVKL